MSQDPQDRAAGQRAAGGQSAGGPTGPADAGTDATPEPDAPRGRHELAAKSPRPEIGPVHRTGLSGMVRGGRSRMAFGTLAAMLCLLLGPGELRALVPFAFPFPAP